MDLEGALVAAQRGDLGLSSCAMSMNDYFDTLCEQWTDEVIVCSLGTTTDTWWTKTRSKHSFYVNAAMGFAASFALGLALTCPDQRIWMLDSDGALAMNLGGLLTEASIQPPNYVHVVLNNRAYGCLGGAPLVNADRTDYGAIARGAGIQNVHEVSSRESFASELAVSRVSHSFIVAEVQPDPPRSGFEPPLTMPIDGPESKYLFGRFLEERLGRSVFGPNGY